MERGHYAITIEEGVPVLGREMQGLKQMLADFERDLGALQVNGPYSLCRLGSASQHLSTRGSQSRCQQILSGI